MDQCPATDAAERDQAHKTDDEEEEEEEGVEEEGEEECLPPGFRVRRIDESHSFTFALSQEVV